MTTAMARPLRISALTVCLALWGLVAANSAGASTYLVQQCNSQNFGTADVVQEGNSTGPRLDNFCGGSGDFLQAGSSGAVAPQAYRQWAFQVPAHTRMNELSGFYSMQSGPNPNGQKAYVFVRESGQGDKIIDETGAAGTGFSNVGFSMLLSGYAPLTRFGIGVRCSRSSAEGNCAASSGTYAQIGQLNMYMEDVTAPARPTISGAALTGWHNGTTAVAYSVSDQGAGVRWGSTLINGTGFDLESYCTPPENGSGNAKQMKPCPSTGTGGSTLTVSDPVFKQGENELTHCVAEYGTNAQTACETATFKVDTIEPGAISNPVVDGGQDWHRDNDFDISWTNRPDAPDSSPIVGAELRIVGNNYDQTSWHPGNDIESISNVEVPEKGAYTAQVYLVDAAGNMTNLFGAISQSVELKYDDTIPEPQRPGIANGWINTQDLTGGYLQRWENVPDQLVPPSGIAGYRVTVNRSPDSDPCTGAVDPRACGGGLTEVGRDNRMRTLHTDDVEEGTNYVHVVPVSGSGMRATEVRHTSLKVDVTGPSSQLQGDGDGQWTNHPVEVTAIAHDALSGMTDTDEFPDDDPPATFLRVDSGATVAAVGSTASTTISGEGEHQVEYWSRDLAGNDEDRVNAATVRIDETAPRAAFTNSQDPDDPDMLVAPVSDALSGVAAGTIAYRQAGGGSWKALETVLRDDQLIARVDSADMRPGVTYEFRVQATDKAGNTVTSNRKQNGEYMKVVGPFRALTEIVDLRVDGKEATRIKYGKGAKVTGAVVRQNGGPVGGAKVAITETYAEGSKVPSRTTTVATNGDGRFALDVARGPSRTISARYAGDRRYLGTSSAAAKLAVKGKVSLKVPRRVSSRKGITFKGKVGVNGADLGKRGKRLEVQVHVGKKWKAVGRSIRTNSKGKFKLPYRFTADYPRAVRYEFRAKVLPERGFPYLPAKSKVRKVTVTP